MAWNAESQAFAVELKLVRMATPSPDGEMPLLHAHRPAPTASRNPESLQQSKPSMMADEDHNDAVLMTTTDVHLARGIGEVMHHAYQGEFEFHLKPDENLLRVDWTH